MLRTVLLLAAVAVALAGWYAVGLWWHPSARCRGCRGTGWRKFLWLQWRCHRCRGLGEHARFGVRMWRRLHGLPVTPAWVDDLVTEREMHADWRTR